MLDKNLPPETWFMPYRQTSLPPLSKEIKALALSAFVLVLFFSCILLLGSQEQRGSFNPASLKPEVRVLALDRFQQSDIHGAMTIITNAIRLQKNQVTLFDLQRLDALNRQDLELQMLESLEK